MAVCSLLSASGAPRDGVTFSRAGTAAASKSTAAGVEANAIGTRAYASRRTSLGVDPAVESLPRADGTYANCCSAPPAIQRSAGALQMGCECGEVRSKRCV
eukprot:5887168-Prymnesium_polylepis.2